MKTLLLIGLGGGIGSILRYMMSSLLPNPLGFPIQILVINCIGSFVFGLVMGYSQQLGKRELLFLTTGLCGGFTTFSSFVFDLYMFLKSEKYLLGSVYLVLQMILSVLAVAIGYSISYYLLLKQK